MRSAEPRRQEPSAGKTKAAGQQSSGSALNMAAKTPGNAKGLATTPSGAPSYLCNGKHP